MQRRRTRAVLLAVLRGQNLSLSLSVDVFLLFLWYFCHLLSISSGLSSGSLTRLHLSSSSRSRPLPSPCLLTVSSLHYSSLPPLHSPFSPPHCPTTRPLFIHFLPGCCCCFSGLQLVFWFVLLSFLILRIKLSCCTTAPNSLKTALIILQME